MTDSLSDNEQPYQALCRRVGIVRLPPRTLIAVSGADRATFLHNLCTNDIKQLQDGEGCEAFFTDVRGKILGFAMLHCEQDTLWIDTVADQAETLLPHLDRYLIREDVVLADRSQDWRQLLLCGPTAADLLQSCGLDVPKQMLEHRVIVLADKTARLRRVPWLVPDSYLLQLGRADVEVALEAATDAGATLCEAEVFETRRIESGLPEYGKDITSDNLPQEVGRDDTAISFTKGCYLGQETVARIDALGHVNRYLVGLQFQQVPLIGTELKHEDATVGRITSACFSPQLGTGLALGYVRRERANVGDELESPLGVAKVVKLPI